MRTLLQHTKNEIWPDGTAESMTVFDIDYMDDGSLTAVWDAVLEWRRRNGVKYVYEMYLDSMYSLVHCDGCQHFDGHYAKPAHYKSPYHIAKLVGAPIWPTMLAIKACEAGIYAKDEVINFVKAMAVFWRIENPPDRTMEVVQAEDKILQEIFRRC